MSRKASSQWDFGELFPAEQTRKVLSVGELTGQVKRLLEQKVGQVWVSGEVTNLRVQSSGHCYFTLKDATAQLSCVLFRGDSRTGRTLLEDGRKVLLQGDVTVYELRGQYQLIVTAVELLGMGALQLAFERLKQRLQAEGLFASERKRAMPPIPARIGVVTSPTGAALQDVLHVVQRRDPGLEIVLAPCRVQGAGAAEQIAVAIRHLNEFHQHRTGGHGPGRLTGGLDLILVTRGGGSLEDLWAFNEEVVARAIFSSTLPVMSAVGHEIDFTIADFVADVRAATPSAAAELITGAAVACRDFVQDAPARLAELVRRQCESRREELDEATRRLARAHPRRRLNDQWQRLDELMSALDRTTRFRIEATRARWMTVAAAWLRLRPAVVLARHRERLGHAQQRLVEHARNGLDAAAQRAGRAADRLRLLAPDNVLARGYSITFDRATGRVIRDHHRTCAGQQLTTRLLHGEVRSVVED